MDHQVRHFYSTNTGNYFELLKTITVRLGDPRNFSNETLLPVKENVLTCWYEKNAEFVDWKKTKKTLQIDLLNKPVLRQYCTVYGQQQTA